MVATITNYNLPQRLCLGVPVRYYDVHSKIYHMIKGIRTFIDAHNILQCDNGCIRYWILIGVSLCVLPFMQRQLMTSAEAGLEGKSQNERDSFQGTLQECRRLLLR